MERVTLAGALALGALLACGARASEDVRWYTQIDNDVLFGTDRFYTSGLRIARTSAVSGGRLELGIVQEIYTPETTAVPRSRFDHPYVARLALSAAKHIQGADLHRTLEAMLGVRGPSAYGRQSQDFVHRFVPAPQTDWTHQLPDRVDVQAVGCDSRIFTPFPSRRERIAWHYGGVLGNNLTLVHTGLELRTAKAAPNSALRFAATPPIAADGARGFGAFAGASARAVLRNALLDGNEGVDSTRTLEKRPVVFRLAAGIAWTASWGAITFGAAQDTREFKGQRAPVRYGLIGVRLDFL
jgi:hypothetical protein